MPVRPARDFQGLLLLTNDWPIIVIEFPEARVPDDALRACLSSVEDLLKEARDGNQWTFTVTDLTRMVEFPSAVQRACTSEWLARTLALQKAASLGAATVTRSTLLRGVVNAVQWISPPALPSPFVATREEAMIEARKVFDARRIPLRASLSDVPRGARKSL
ncbi:MAG TPA: hypothetical protein VGI39_27890 [Polyangiaceae bacterium]